MVAGCSLHATMKVSTLCYMMAATAVAGTAAAQQAAPYIDTAYGWKPVLMEIVEVPVPLQQTLPSGEQMARRHTGVVEIHAVQNTEGVGRHGDGRDHVMFKGAVPVEHEEDDEGEGQVHHKEDPPAGAVLDTLGPHPLAGGVSSRVADQKVPHDGQTDIVRAEGVEPKGVVVKSEAELEYRVRGVPDKASVKRKIHPQMRVLTQASGVFIVSLEALEKGYHTGYSEAYHRQRICRENV